MPIPVLSRVTLCCVECVNHELALAAIGQSLQKCDFARVIFVTDREFDLDGVEVVRIAPLLSPEAHSRFVIKELVAHIQTEFVLMIQWDGFVINADAWTDDFLAYDYVGARSNWPADGHTAGSGEFSLRSKRLLSTLADERIGDSVPDARSSGPACQSYLEAKYGIRFAPDNIADGFALDGSYSGDLPFGFNGLPNFSLFFRGADLAAFLRMATPSILGSAQCMQLAKNFVDGGRSEEAQMVLREIVAAHPAHPTHSDAALMLGKLRATPAVAPGKSPGRNDPCTCGSGKRYKECHGRLGQSAGEEGAPGASIIGGIGPALDRGLATHRQGDLIAADLIYRQVLLVEPGNAIARHYRGVIAYQQFRFEEARLALEGALPGNELQPDFHSNLGLVLHKLGELDRAIGCFERALELKPDYVEGHNNLGMALQDQHRYDEALASFDRALALRPNFPDAHWNRALLYLLNGDFERGWDEYEWRLRHPSLGLSRQSTFSQPRWDGSDPRGRTLLVYCEQGFGDALQFIRYAAVLRDRGAKVIIEAPRPLCRLFAAIDGVSVIAQGEPLPRFDVQVPLLSLPLAHGTRVDSIPRSVPYLFGAPDESRKWADRLAQDRGFRVGIVWAGNQQNQPGRHRTCPPERFGALARIEGTSFYSLQKERPAGVAAPALTLADFTEDLTDFAATAALIANLDLVLTVDTAVAHLAGALGKPVWVLLPFERDWRWLRDRDDSPWYPTMRLFQQTRRGEWVELFDRVASALRTGVGERAGRSRV